MSTEHACRDCESCGCECPEACAWPCPCDSNEDPTPAAPYTEQETTNG